MSIALGQIGPALKTLLTATAHRGELASLEMGEARDHIAVTMLLSFGAAALALLGGFAGTFTIAALVWERADRVLILGLVTLAYILIAGALVWFAARRLRTWRPLEETCRQLQQDGACLQNILNPSAESHSV